MKKNLAITDSELILKDMFPTITEIPTLPITANDIIKEIRENQRFGDPPLPNLLAQIGQRSEDSPPPNLLAQILEEQYPESTTMQTLKRKSTLSQLKSHSEKKAKNQSKEKKRKGEHHNQEKNKKARTQKKINTRPLKLGPGFNLLYEMGKRHYPELHNHDN